MLLLLTGQAIIRKDYIDPDMYTHRESERQERISCRLEEKARINRSGRIGMGFSQHQPGYTRVLAYIYIYIRIIRDGVARFSLCGGWHLTNRDDAREDVSLLD